MGILLKPKDYIEYLISTQINYTCTNLSHHKQTFSHDAVSDFLSHSKMSSQDLWNIVDPHLEESDNAMIIDDDSVQDKRYSRFIELVKRQYSGNTKSIVQGIGWVNMVYWTGNEGAFYPMDSRIYHPETDNQTKHDHFQEMFMDLINNKQLKVHQLTFDSWYASCANLKLSHRAGWTFFTLLKKNRLVSRSKTSGYQSISELEFSEQELPTGIQVKLNKVPFWVKVFKIVSPDGNID